MTSSYDYIVIGAGSAGCVLANRLSADPQNRVLVLEAGSRASMPMRDMPAAVAQIMANADLDWGYSSEPEPGLNDRRIALNRGKTLGGCSQVNGMIYARGHPADYDDWAKAGCEGWSYADVLPYFRKMETSWAGDGPYHGDSGPLGVSRPNEPTQARELFAQAAREAGYAADHDYHVDPREGFVPMEMTTRKGRRATTATAYLDPVLSRPNLTVVTEAQGARLIIKGDRATGVDYIRNGRAERVAANREIILSAGAYGSPHILMVSGVGPARELASAGVRPIHDIPEVGKGLTEHPMVFMQFAATRSFLDELRWDRAARSAAQWATSGTGPFTTNVCAGNLYVHSEPGIDRSDLQFMLPVIGLDAVPWAPWSKPPVNYKVGLAVIGLKQSSRGSVTLKSGNPAEAPAIRLNLLTEPDDVRRMVAGLRLARHYYSQPGLSALVRKEALPGEDAQTDEALAGFLRSNCHTAHHPVGTCRMGADVQSVVDPQLRVRGIRGLRIADCSIMPSIIGGNTNAPAIMIGEKASDLILADRMMEMPSESRLAVSA